MFKKKIPLLLIISVCTFAVDNINNTVLNIHSFTTVKNRIGIKGSFYKVNDTLDIFNVREHEIGTLSRFGALGDMSGYEGEIRYSLTDRISINYKHEYLDIDYGGGGFIKNKRDDIFLRLNLYYHPYTFINAWSVDLGYTKNSSKPLDITKDEMLNAMIKKIAPNTSLSIKDGVVTYGNYSASIYENGKKVYPFVRVGDLKDSSYYVRLIMGKRFENSIFDLYAGYKKSDIDAKISIEPSNNTLIKDALNKLNIVIPKLSRDEKSYFAGFTYTLEYKDFLFETGYRYVYIDREDDIDYENSNHIIDMSISRIITKNLLFYIGGKIMTNQFNAQIPYLYNRYTQTQYDKKYGYAKFGFVYNFDLNSF